MLSTATAQKKAVHFFQRICL